MSARAAPTRIETNRLLLRRPTAADAEQIFIRYASDAEVTRYMSFRRHQSLADTGMFLDFSEIEWKTQGCGPYLAFSRNSGVLLGGTGLSIQDDDAETGYVFARDAWGYGYATESLLAMIDVARAMQLTELHAHCHPDHRASIHVLEKCRFILEQRARVAHVFPNISPMKQDVLSYILHLSASAVE